MTVQVLHGDCLEVLRGLEDCSVDAVITDPPYGLSNTKPAQVADVLKAWVAGDGSVVPEGRGFMGKSWDGFVPPPAVWEECMRVLKPGGHMAVFAGARTQDLMGLSIRLAGFEIRDTLGWIYGSGFPKSMDIGKAIDKGYGETRSRQLEFTEWMRSTGIKAVEIDSTLGTADQGGHFLRRDSSGARVALADDFDKLRPLLPEVPERIERLVAERTGIEWSDYVKREVVGKSSHKSGIGNATKGHYTVGGTKAEAYNITASASDSAKRWDGWGTALKPAIEPIILARKPLVGTVAANVLAHGVGGLNIDACRVPSDGGRKRPFQPTNNARAVYGAQSGFGPTNAAGRFPANVLLDEHAAKEMDKQSGWSKSPTSTGRGGGGLHGTYSPIPGQGRVSAPGDSGGASRFFPAFKYQAKAPKKERPVIEREDGTKIQHATVKPLALMEWLCALVTPPGGTILDPFAGSGTTLEAARNTAFNAIGIEREADYVELINKRLGNND